jgi:phage protein D
VSIGSVFVVSIAGARLPSDVESLLVSAYVDDSLHRPALFALRFRDPERIVLTKTGVEMGAAVTVSAMGPDGAAPPQALVTGEVTALEVEFDAGGTFTVIRGYDALHRLHRGRRTEAYTQVTASDVAKKVAARAGLSVGTVDATGTVYDHVGQGGQTDLEFLGALAREIGYETTVVDGKFNFRKPRPASDAPSAAGDTGDDPLVLDLGTDLLRVRCAVTSAEQVRQVEVRGWDVATKQALVGTAPAATVSAKLPLTPAALASAFGGPTHVVSDVPYGKQAEVDAAAKAVAERIAGTFAQFEGVARGNPRLRAGTAIALDNLGAPFDGKYTITTSCHRYDASDGYTTSFAVTGRQERSLLGLTSSRGSGRSTPGVVCATVSDVKDPLDQGRVKLTFPWLSDTYVSDWARTVQAGAGKNRGAMVVSEVGDEVLVAFERGDLRRPFVVGGLFNGVDVPKAGAVPLVDSGSGAINRRSMVSRKGHRIDLLDQDGKKEGLLLETGDGKLRLELDATGTKITVHSDGTVTIEGPKGIVVDAGTGKLELKGKEISLTATTGVTVDGGGGAVKVTAGTELALKGTMAKLEGSAQAELKAGAMCTISGALVKIN